MLRRSWWLLFVVFAVTRVGLIYVGVDPSIYGGRDHDIGSDVSIYAGWADGIIEGDVPYRDEPIEYPPGSLPFIVAPALGKAITGLPYRAFFGAAMLAVDVLGLIAVLRLVGHQVSRAGPWLWVLGLAALGPVVWTRLDLVPAVATLWALERIVARAWTSGGVLLAFGAVAKVFPGFLFLPAAAAAPRRTPFLGAGAATALLLLAPFGVVLHPMLSSVAGYHLGRGIQLESVWGGAMLLTGLAGAPVSVEKRFGAWETLGPGTEALGIASTVLAVGVLAGSVAVAWRRRDEPLRLAGVWFATLALLLAVGPVLSPQFMVWLVAVGAGALAVGSDTVRKAALFLLPLAVLTHLVYPISYDGLVAMEPVSVWLLTARNAMLAALAVWSTVGVVRDRPTETHRADRGSRRGWEAP
ncbi:MAG TPA: hypothetical protein VF058_02025 [Actinomycetota bacterium]